MRQHVHVAARRHAHALQAFEHRLDQVVVGDEERVGTVSAIEQQLGDVLAADRADVQRQQVLSRQAARQQALLSLRQVRRMRRNHRDALAMLDQTLGGAIDQTRKVELEQTGVRQSRPDGSARQARLCRSPGLPSGRPRSLKRARHQARKPEKPAESRVRRTPRPERRGVSIIRAWALQPEGMLPNCAARKYRKLTGLRRLQALRKGIDEMVFSRRRSLGSKQHTGSLPSPLTTRDRVGNRFVGIQVNAPNSFAVEVVECRAIFRDGALRPLDPIDLPENTRVTLALLDSDDLAADAIADLAAADKSFEFLNDPREDIYSDSDGEAI